MTPSMAVAQYLDAKNALYVNKGETSEDEIYFIKIVDNENTEQSYLSFTNYVCYDHLNSKMRLSFTWIVRIICIILTTIRPWTIAMEPKRMMLVSKPQYKQLNQCLVLVLNYMDLYQ